MIKETKTDVDNELTRDSSTSEITNPEHSKLNGI